MIHFLKAKRYWWFCLVRIYDHQLSTNLSDLLINLIKVFSDVGIYFITIFVNCCAYFFSLVKVVWSIFRKFWYTGILLI